MIRNYNYPVHSEEWFMFRDTGIKGVYEGGIGASEAGLVMGLQRKYRPSKQELFHFKVGTEVTESRDSEPMFYGRQQEHLISRFWQCYSNVSDHEYYKLYEKYKKKYDTFYSTNYGKMSLHDLEEKSEEAASEFIIRRAIKGPGYLVNDKYPWLFASKDYSIEVGSNKLTGGEVITKRCPLEIKTIRSVISNQWQSGIPMYHVAQLTQQMIVTETDYSEIAMLEDGNRLIVIPVELSDNFANELLDRTYDFWQNNVIPAREMLQDYRHLKKRSPQKAEETLSHIYSLEPDVDGSENTEKYLKERYRKEFEFILAEKGWYKHAYRYDLMNKMIKALEEYKIKCKNNLIRLHVKNSVEKINFGKHFGYSTLSKDNKGTPKFNVNLKKEAQASKDKVREELEKISLK